MRWIPVVFATFLSVAGPLHAQSVGEVEDWYDIESEARGREGEEQAAQDEAMNDAIDQGVDLTNWGVDVAVTGRELYDDWNSLDAAEANCGAAYRADAGPTVPSRCAESNECRSCYESAVKSIDFNRFYIERARCITVANLKMANSAMAFGDSTSGIHGVMGLSWQLQGKPQIKEATESLKKTYAKKAGEYLTAMDRALKKLGECEARYYGDDDWYQRYGWIYLSFMKAKYESSPD